MDDAVISKSKTQQRRKLPTRRPYSRRIGNASRDTDVTEIVMITSYPPRECGIATFSLDLQKALSDKFNGSFKLSICPLTTNSSVHDYKMHNALALNTDAQLDYLRVSRQINENDNCGLVLIQHEFGLFSKNEESFLEFLEFVNKPLLFTFHTVLPEPDDIMRGKVKKMASLAEGIIVMTKTSADILSEDYGITKNLITVIPHGTHLVSYKDKAVLKKKYGLEGKQVLSTFGLLGPGKNVETTLDALPTIVDEHPETVFLIIGKTHPTLVERHGEDYRKFLHQKIDSLGIGEHVRFVDEFVPLSDLLEYLQLTDIYLFTSKDRNQAVSGTFSYALSCGCPIVSTPIPHALEVLQNEAGILFDFEASDQLAQSVVDLLHDDATREDMSLRGLQSSMESSWQNAAIAHARLFKKLCNRRLDLKFKKPELRLDHLRKMTTETGIIQFSKINQPDITSGYTLDDNARALITVCRHFELTKDVSVLPLIHRYFTFVKNCYRPDGTFLNYVDEHHHFTAQNGEVNLEDANGRAMWALGYLVYISDCPFFNNDVLSRNAECIFLQGLETMREFRSPRAVAFILKGLYYFNKYRVNCTAVEFGLEFSNYLVNRYNEASDTDWKWFESYLTYGNSVIPEGLLMGYMMTGEFDYKLVAKKSFDFLLSKIF